MDTCFRVAAILVGLACCFYGYLLFRIFLVLAGLIYGYLLGQLLVPAADPWVSLATGIIAAVVLALLAYPLWIVGIVIAGGALGFMFVSSLGLAWSTPAVFTILIGLTGALAVGLLFYNVRDLFVMLVTALNGAILVVLGMSMYIPAMILRYGQTNYLDLAITVMLGGFGFAVQYGVFKDRRTYSS
jgi:hypothetical protein